MTTQTPTPLLPGRPDWATGPLNEYLNQIFPLARTKRGLLDVYGLRAPLGKTHESIYKWLRSSRLTPENASRLCAHANTPENVAALAADGRLPPTIEDFHRFVFA